MNPVEMTPRRYVILEVTPDVIANICSGTYRVTANAWPKGTRIVSRRYDPRRDTFQLTLEHESFGAITEARNNMRGLYAAVDGVHKKRDAAAKN